MSYKGNIRTRNITMDKKWHYKKKKLFYLMLEVSILQEDLIILNICALKRVSIYNEFKLYKI